MWICIYDTVQKVYQICPILIIFFFLTCHNICMVRRKTLGLFHFFVHLIQHIVGNITIRSDRHYKLGMMSKYYCKENDNIPSNVESYLNQFKRNVMHDIMNDSRKSKNRCDKFLYEQ